MICGCPSVFLSNVVFCKIIWDCGFDVEVGVAVVILGSSSVPPRISYLDVETAVGKTDTVVFPVEHCAQRIFSTECEVRWDVLIG